ncbi:hypothetical protein L9G15_08170 [Shewanella sp. A3A]|nr:hypothetical protein [Shewanella ferrihydritica]
MNDFNADVYEFMVWRTKKGVVMLWVASGYAESSGEFALIMHIYTYGRFSYAKLAR